jgi:DNA-binding response OmpR family regulator
VTKTIFVVEDDADISRLIKHHLEAASYAVRTFSSGANLISEAVRVLPSLFLLDIALPGDDGTELCRSIRSHPPLAALPVIFVTARNSENDRVLGLEIGADDYVSKPFSPRELVARVRAVLRRFDAPLKPALKKAGSIEVDTGSMTLRVKDKVVPTTATEFRLLDYFMSHTGRVFSRDQLLDAVWRDTAFVTPRSIDVYVRRLREKIETDPENPQHLKTMRGAGYLFDTGGGTSGLAP